MKQKDLSMLLNTARLHMDNKCHKAKDILEIFGYSPSTYLGDTKAYQFGLVEPIRTDNGVITYRVIGMITRCWGVRQLRQLAKLPKGQRQYISDGIIRQVREEAKGLWYDDEDILPRIVA